MAPSRSRPVAGRPALVLGIVNVTPDSFSDGGRFFDTTAAVTHALDLVTQGADLLDIGGESSRPGAQPVSEDEELRRVLPVVRELAARTNMPLSIDTTKAGVAEACLAAGRTSSTTLPLCKVILICRLWLWLAAPASC